MDDFQKKLEERRKQQVRAQLTAIADFKIFIQKNYPTAIGTPSGLHYLVTEEGSGPRPNKMQQVTVHYTGKLTNGTVFDSSYKRNQPFTFQLGAGRVIKGWEEGVALLNKGTKAQLIIPHFLGYGEQGHPPQIPARAAMIFEIELLDFL